MRPDLTRVPPFYHDYINQVEEENVMDTLRKNTPSMTQFFARIPSTKRDHRYAEGKWSIRQLLQHLIDAERIFSYRALRFARKDETPLPGFDENLYADTARVDQRSWNDMIEEFAAVRKSTELMFASFNEDELESAGIASGGSTYVRGIGFIIAGHCNHHKRIIEERYL